MSIKEIVDGILKEKRRPLTWLARGMHRTRDGLALGLENESIKYRDIVIMAQLLEVSPCRLFATNEELIIPEQNIVSETTFQYGNQKACEELVASLKDQLTDKERIIILLSQGNGGHI